MSTAKRVALAGATGNLGPAILKALLDSGFFVTILTRSPISTLPYHTNQTIKVVDYASQPSLEAALKNIDVVVSNVARQGIALQKTLIDASIAAGVQRFLPSEFGNDIGNELNAAFPFFHEKVAIRKYLKLVSSQNANFSYTFFLTEAFLDWGIEVGFLVDPKGHTATLYDGGDRPFSATRLSTIGQGIVKLIQNWELDSELARNQEVFVHDGVVTQNRIINAFKRVENGKHWSTRVRDTEELMQWAYDEWNKPDDGNIVTSPDGDSDGGKRKAKKDILGASFAFIYTGIYRQGHGGDFSGRTWNRRLGIKELTEFEMDDLLVHIAMNFKGDFTLPQLTQ